jgi:hypothetical protein
MQPPNFASYTDPPDLLRRFVQTPLKAIYRVGTIRVSVETNDFALLPELSLDAQLNEPCAQFLEWKLIRDADSPGLLAPSMFLTSRTLTVVNMGPACVIGIDHERHKLIGFIGMEIDSRTFQKFLVPFLCQIASDTLLGNPTSRFAEWNDNSFDV